MNTAIFILIMQTLTFLAVAIWASMQTRLNKLTKQRLDALTQRVITLERKPEIRYFPQEPEQ
jgi:hypothetical protein